MYKDPTLHSMHLGIPHAVYGSCDYFIPKPFKDWLNAHSIDNYFYCGGHSSGNGFNENGRSTAWSTYMIYNIHPEDASVLKIVFPEVTIHLSQQHDYTKTETNTRTKSRKKDIKKATAG